jgi:hypothetical protein
MQAAGASSSAQEYQKGGSGEWGLLPITADISSLVKQRLVVLDKELRQIEALDPAQMDTATRIKARKDLVEPSVSLYQCYH